MLNRVILMGRITADPELKTTNTGVSVTSFSIAVDRNYVKQGEERKADFFNIVCWRSTAEFVCRYFGKGSLIAVEGQLQSRQFQAKDGSNRYVVEVVADNFRSQANAVTTMQAATIILWRQSVIRCSVLRRKPGLSSGTCSAGTCILSERFKL